MTTIPAAPPQSPQPQTGSLPPPSEIRTRYHLRGTPNGGLVMATWGFFIGFAAVALYGPTAKTFQTMMGLSGLSLGLLLGAPQLTGSLLRIPFGAWVDRVGGRKPMLVLLGLSLAGMAGLIFILYGRGAGGGGPGLYPLVLFFGFLSGCGVASFSVGIPQTSYWFPRSKQGLALGLYGGLGNLSPGLFTLLLPLALAAWGLTGSYVAWFLFLLAGTVVYAIFSRDAFAFQIARHEPDRARANALAAAVGQELLPSGKVLTSLKQAASLPRTWGLVIMYFTSFGGFLALTAWFPNYWLSLHHLGLVEAGILGGVGFSLVSALVRIGGGSLADRIGGERTAVLSYAVVACGAAVLAVSTRFGVDVFGEVLIAVGMGVGNAAVFKLVARYVPHAVGGASGLVGGLGAFGGFVIPPVLGLVVDRMGPVGFARGFTVYVGLALLALVLALVFQRRPMTVT